jgi:lycopene cyclase domain-containing protein
MTYLQFHIVFNAPLLAVLIWFALPTWCGVDWFAMLVTAFIVMVFTSPWDNWAINHGVWDFPRDRILGRILYCPLEEYAFFLIQTAQGCLLAHIINWKLIFVPVTKRPEPDWILVGAIAVAWAIVALSRRFNLISLPRSMTYLWHLLFWMLPVVAIQWALGGVWIGNDLVVIPTTLILGSVLCLFDAAAISRGIWYFDETQTMGWSIGGVLPFEEALFFYLTSLLVAQSYLLFL